jgi:hypothetical protein
LEVIQDGWESKKTIPQDLVSQVSKHAPEGGFRWAASGKTITQDLASGVKMHASGAKSTMDCPPGST